MSVETSSHTPVAAADDPLESTIDLLARAKQGEERAVERLFERCHPALQRWARGRLPHYARDLADTQDVVQEAMLSTLHRLNSFTARRRGGLEAYLRQAVINRIRDEIRRVGRRPPATELDEQQADIGPSPLQHAIEREELDRYESALQKLRPADRDVIVARMERQQSYEEVAVALGKPNASAARMALTRALTKLAHEMERER